MSEIKAPLQIPALSGSRSLLLVTAELRGFQQHQSLREPRGFAQERRTLLAGWHRWDLPSPAGYRAVALRKAWAGQWREQLLLWWSQPRSAKGSCPFAASPTKVLHITARWAPAQFGELSIDLSTKYFWCNQEGQRRPAHLSFCPKPCSPWPVLGAAKSPHMC